MLRRSFCERLNLKCGGANGAAAALPSRLRRVRFLLRSARVAGSQARGVIEKVLFDRSSATVNHSLVIPYVRHRVKHRTYDVVRTIYRM